MASENQKMIGKLHLGKRRKERGWEGLGKEKRDNEGQEREK